MIVVVQLVTKRGGKREIELPATSVEDALNSIRDLYVGCTIKFAKIKNGDNDGSIRSNQTEAG